MSLAHRMAIENPQITSACIEATEFPDLVRAHRVTGVPKTVVSAPGGEVRAEILGAVPEAEFVGKIIEAASAP